MTFISRLLLESQKRTSKVSHVGKTIADLKRKLMRYIRKYNEQPKPVKWKYFDPTRNITPASIVTGH